MILEWILGIVGALGFAGAVALALFAPGVLLIVWQAVLGITKAVLSTRIGCAGLALVLGLAAGDIYGDLNGRSVEKAKCVAAQKRADEAAIKRDDQQGQLGESDDAARLARLEQQAKDDQETIDVYRSQLERAAKGGACALSDDDLRGLRDDAGANPKARR